MKNYYFAIAKKKILFLLIFAICTTFIFELKAKTVAVARYNFSFGSATRFQDLVIEDQSFSIDEASAPGTLVGQIKVSDNSTITSYDIKAAKFLKANNPPPSDSSKDPEYNALMVFKLNSGSGELRVNKNKYLLAELGPIQLEVEVTDNMGAITSATITVTVKDLEVTIADNYTLAWSEVKANTRSTDEATGGMVNGKLYVFGGFTSTYAPQADVDAYDPANNTWAKLKDMPPMADDSGGGGATHMGWAQDGTNIYIAAGYAADKSGTRQQFGSRRVYRYNVAEDSYTELPELPIDRSAGALEFLNNKLYYIGGTNRARTEDQGDVFVLDLDAQGAGWKSLSNMPNPRHHIGSAVYDGKIYIFGGQKEHDEKLIPQDDVHCYDPITDTWEQVTDMPKPFNHIHTSVFTYGDLIYSIGGQINHNKGAYADVYAYSPKANKWVQFTDLPKKRFAIVCDAVDGHIYASGGNNSRATFAALLPDEVLGLESGSEFNAVSDEIKLYPNPSRGVLFVHFAKAAKEVKKIQLLDVNGRILFEKALDFSAKTSDIKIITSSLSSGIYLVKIQDVEGKVQTSRFAVK